MSIPLALDALNFLSADVRNLFGPFINVFLVTGRHWTQTEVGLMSTAADCSASRCKRRSAQRSTSRGRSAASSSPPWPRCRSRRWPSSFPRRFWPMVSRDEPAGDRGRRICAGGRGADPWRHAEGRFRPATRAQLGFRSRRKHRHCACGGRLRLLVLPAGRLPARALLRGPHLGRRPQHPARRHRPPSRAGSRRGGPRGRKASGYSALFKTRPLVIFAGCAFLFHFANAPLLPLVGQKLALQFPKEATAMMSFCMVAAQAVMIPIALVVGWRADRWGRRPIFLVAFAVLPIRAALYPLSDNAFWLLGLQLLDGVGAGIYQALTPLVIADMMRGQRTVQPRAGRGRHHPGDRRRDQQPVRGRHRRSFRICDRLLRSRRRRCDRLGRLRPADAGDTRRPPAGRRAERRSRPVAIRPVTRTGSSGAAAPMASALPCGTPRRRG